MDFKTVSFPSSAAKPRLLDQVRQAIRARHYSPRTEETYVGWIKRFKLFQSFEPFEWFEGPLKPFERFELIKRIERIAAGLLEDGYDIRTVQEPLGHFDVTTTMVYTHVLNRGGRGIRSPVDGLAISLPPGRP